MDKAEGPPLTLTQMGEFTVNPPATGGVIRRSVSIAALIAPAVAGAAVSANVVGVPYKKASAVEDDFGDDSALAAGASAAFRSGATRLIVGSYEETAVADELIAGSNTGATGTGTLANLPVLDVTSVTVDGTEMTTITFTEGDPTAQSPAATEVIINPHTGVIQTGTDTSGADAGILVDYSYTDIDALTEQLDTRAFRVLTVAGETLNSKSYGLVMALLAYAAESNKQVVFALDSGVAPADESALVTAVQDKRLALIAAHYTGDLSSAWAALLAARPPQATRKDQEAPAGVSYTDTYIRREFGDDRDPAAGTWHALGVNAVYRDPGNTFRTSSDRAAVGYTSAYRWMSTYAVERKVTLDAEDDVRASRQSSDVGMPYTDSGIAALESTIRSSFQRNAQDGVISRLVNVTMPTKDEIAESDISARAVVGAEVTFEHAGQIHTAFVTLNSTL